MHLELGGGAYKHVEFEEAIAHSGVVSCYANLYVSCNPIHTDTICFSEVDFNMSPFSRTCRARPDAGIWKKKKWRSHIAI